MTPVRYRGLTVDLRRQADGYCCKVEGKYYIILDDAEISDFYSTGVMVGFVEIDPATLKELK